MCIHSDADEFRRGLFSDIQKGVILEKPKSPCISKYVFQNSPTNSKMMSPKRSSKFEVRDLPTSLTGEGKNLPRQNVW